MRKTIDFKKISIDLTNDWIAVFNPKSYNWVSFNYLKIYSENDRTHGCKEIELYLLGFGVRFYWVSDKKRFNKKIKQYLDKKDFITLEEAIKRVNNDKKTRTTRNNNK